MGDGGEEKVGLGCSGGGERKGRAGLGYDM